MSSQGWRYNGCFNLGTATSWSAPETTSLRIQPQLIQVVSDEADRSAFSKHPITTNKLQARRTRISGLAQRARSGNQKPSNRRTLPAKQRRSKKQQAFQCRSFDRCGPLRMHRRIESCPQTTFQLSEDSCDAGDSLQDDSLRGMEWLSCA